MVYTRDFNSFKDDEIISVVDFVVSASHTVGSGGDMRFRKIEVMLYQSNLLARVSFSVNAKDRPTVIAFMIVKVDDDILVNPVIETIYEKFFIKDFLKLNSDLVLDRGVLETYRFFNEELDYWNTDRNKWLRNVPLTSDWYCVESNKPLKDKTKQ